MAEQQNQTVFDLPKVTAVGIASPAAGVLTSGFGVAGTLVGMALTAVIVTVVTDVLKVYLARAPGAVTSIPGGFRKRPRWRNALTKLRLPFSKFLSLPPAQRRSVLIGSLATSVVSLLIGVGMVTGVELGVGKSLSCWVWDECTTETSTADGSTSRTSTLGSIFGQPNRSLPAEQPPDVKQGLPSQRGDIPGSVPGSEQPVSPRPDQRESPSGVPEDRQVTPSPAEGWYPSEGDRSTNEQNEGEQNKVPAAKDDHDQQ